jgi:hypothetical protein
MNIIYSDEKIEGLEGVYANPSLFNGDLENCQAVYTDREEIKQAYEKRGIKVLPLPKPKSKKSLLDK